MSKFKLDEKARYAKTHEWVRMEDNVAVVGISDAAQDMLSDVVYIELPKVGAQVTAGQQAAVVESVKAAEDVISPVSGTVIAVNEALVNAPETVNGDPYGSWFYRVEPGSALQSELDALMDAEAYGPFAEEAAH